MPAVMFIIFLTGCGKENQISKPEVITSVVKEITATKGYGGGRIKSVGALNIISAGVCWSSNHIPTISDNTTIDIPVDGEFSSLITGLSANTKYILRAYATDGLNTIYGQPVEFKTFLKEDTPRVNTFRIDDIKSNSVIAKGNVIAHGGTIVSERGFFLSEVPEPEISGLKVPVEQGLGEFQTILDGLNPRSSYYVKAYAQNSSGISYGEQIDFITLDGPACDFIEPPSGFGLVAYDGKCWLDRNIGASGIAQTPDDENSFGHLFQWGRENDGHQYRTSDFTTILAPSGSQPGHSDYIANDDHPFDWNNDNNWAHRWININGSKTISDPCPVGWRVPTRSEWVSAMNYGDWESEQDAFDSPLRLPSAGKRDDKGAIYDAGTRGFYWSSSSYNLFGEALLFFEKGAFISNYYRVGGMSVRCIKDHN